MKQSIRFAWLFVFLTTLLPARADVYIIGSDVNGHEWECGAEDAKMTEQIPGVLYFWEGETLGKEFKFNSGDWSEGNFPGTSIPANVGASASQTALLSLGREYPVMAGGSSVNIRLSAEIERVVNPRVTLNLMEMTVIVEGEAIKDNHDTEYDIYDYSNYYLFIKENNPESERFYTTELISEADHSYIVRNVSLHGWGDFDLETPNRQDFFGYVVIKNDWTSDEKNEVTLSLALPVTSDPFNPSKRGLTYRAFNFTGVYDVEITYSGNEAKVKFVKKADLAPEEPNVIEDLLYVRMFGDYNGENETIGWVDERLGDHAIIYRNVYIPGDGNFYLEDTKSGLKFGGGAAVAPANLTTTLKAESDAAVSTKGLEGYYDIKVTFNDTFTSATVTFTNELAPEYAEYTGDLYIVGSGNGWQLADPEYKLTCKAPGIYEWTGAELASDFKINGGDWDAKIPGTDARLDFGGIPDELLYPDVAYRVLVRGRNISLAGGLEAVHNVKLTLNLQDMTLLVDADEHIYPEESTATLRVFNSENEGSEYKAEPTDTGIIFSDIEFTEDGTIVLYFDGNSYGFANIPAAGQTLTATNTEVTVQSSATMSHFPFAVPTSIKGTYSVFVTFGDEYKTATIRVEGEETPVVPGDFPEKLYLVGTMNNWTLPVNGNLVEIPSVGEGVYSATLNIAANEYDDPISFKVFNTLAADWMNGEEYYGAMIPGNETTIFSDSPAKWRLAPGWGSADMRITNATSLRDAVVTVNLNDSTMTISSAAAAKFPTEVYLVDGGANGSKYALQRDGESTVFKGSASLPEGSRHLTFAGSDGYRLGSDGLNNYLWRGREDRYTMLPDSELPFVAWNWTAGQLEVAVDIATSVATFVAPDQPELPNSIWLVVNKSNGEQTRVEVPAFEYDGGHRQYELNVADWQEEARFSIEVPGIGLLRTDAEPFELYKSESLYTIVNPGAPNDIVISNWEGGNLWVSIPEAFRYVYFGSATQPMKERSLYLIGSPQDWKIDDGSMKLTQVDNYRFTGAFDMPADPIFRFYTELGNWEDNSWGSQYDDAPIAVTLTADEELRETVVWGKGSWSFTGFPGGMMYMEIDLWDHTAVFSMQPTDAVAAVDAEQVIVTVVADGIEVNAPQDSATIVYDFAGRIAGRGEGSCHIALQPGLYIVNRHKIIVR